MHELRDEEEDEVADGGGAGGTHPGTKWGSLPQRLKAAMAQEASGGPDDVDLSESMCRRFFTSDASTPSCSFCSARAPADARVWSRQHAHR